MEDKWRRKLMNQRFLGGSTEYYTITTAPRLKRSILYIDMERIYLHHLRFPWPSAESHVCFVECGALEGKEPNLRNAARCDVVTLARFFKFQSLVGLRGLPLPEKKCQKTSKNMNRNRGFHNRKFFEPSVTNLAARNPTSLDDNISSQDPCAPLLRTRRVAAAMKIPRRHSWSGKSDDIWAFDGGFCLDLRWLLTTMDDLLLVGLFHSPGKLDWTLLEEPPCPGGSFDFCPGALSPTRFAALAGEDKLGRVVACNPTARSQNWCICLVLFSEVWLKYKSLTVYRFLHVFALWRAW